MAEQADNACNSSKENNILRNDYQERKRMTTDVAPLVIYGIFVIAWIIIVLYAIICSRVSPFRMMGLVIEFLGTGLFFSPAIFFFTALCILLAIFYFVMLRWSTKLTVYLTIFLKFLFIMLPLIAVGFEIYPEIIVPPVLFSLTIFMIEIQISKTVGVDFVCKIIVDTCKAIIAFPSSLLIALLSFVSTASMCIVIATVIDCLVSAQNVYVVNTSLIIIFSILSGWILIIGNLCMLFVLHGMFTSWCRMANKNLIPKCTISLQHLFYAFRYHIGSFAFMSIPIVSIIQVIRTICANIHTLELKFKESPYNIYCFLVILGNIFNNTSVACASYGKCFYPSMKDAFKVLIQHPMKFTAARLVITAMIFYGLILIPGIVIGMTGLHTAIWNIYNYQLYLIVISSISIIIACGLFFILSAAVDSVLFCHLEELIKKGESANEGLEIILLT